MAETGRTVVEMQAAARRIRLHHVLVRRRRWSRDLDRLTGVAVLAEWPPPDEPLPAGDYWRDAGTHLRKVAGRWVA